MPRTQSAAGHRYYRRDSSCAIWTVGLGRPQGALTPSGHGPDKFIHAVGAGSHATASFDAVVDKPTATVLLGTDRPHALRAAMACRPGGVVSVPGFMRLSR
jgi:hypothetical protein